MNKSTVFLPSAPNIELKSLMPTFLAVNLKFSSVIAGFLPHGNSQKLILAAPWHAAGEGLFLFSIWIGFAIQVWDVIFTALEEYLNFK
ncbi:MAG: hypothetical protein CO092_00740 [Candidatus Aenigmarchaeota archaeon CG_4_9_14_3_um_filter_37_18]|nr:MAG: hypothetical protein COS07_03645 [Candidatus Aenigmarchaeota archaeon CG01_land_8_20_14_3_00_37_9]PIX50448.1 MAG: hypothetical protein COZ52_04125 [Candidatus Aenigmarchaeota archaeon CG_4_8_14_3_um_filter_37_24]PJB75860.1 MAG: hypothetical protein CO092_00740 [Candidatus Aenigmarchaeota archaeon CG_4_9_14_3_um_filter_37_18]